MISPSGHVCIVATKDFYHPNIHQHPDNALKSYKIDTCEFEEVIIINLGIFLSLIELN